MSQGASSRCRMHSRVAVFMLLMCVAVTGCGKRRYRNVSIKNLETTAPFSAKVETIVIITNLGPAVAYVGLKTTDGRRLAIGGELEEERGVVEFAGRLSERQTYEFPKTWVEFRESKNKTGEK